MENNEELISREEVLSMLCHYCHNRCNKNIPCAQWYAIVNLETKMYKGENNNG